MSATYCHLVGLSGVERIAVLDALDLPELALSRQRIEPGDRLVIVARDVAAEAAGITASTWRRLGRKVDVIPPQMARTWGRSQPVPVRRMPIPASPPVRYGLASHEWQRRPRTRTVPTPCAFCDKPITCHRAPYDGERWAHETCLSGARRDLMMLDQAGRKGIWPTVARWAERWNKERIARLVASGLIALGDDGAYYRTTVPVTGG